MAHHGNDPTIFNEQFQKLLHDQLLSNLGPTGKFPEGHLNADDEGEIAIAIGKKDDKVILDFGKPIAWIGFTAEQAEQIASSLIEKASQIREERKQRGRRR